MKKFKYNYEYHKILVYKVLNCRKPGKVFLTFEDTLEIIKKLYAITDEIKQIVYLAGWQYDGHDSKYPAWFEVNHHLKRKQDENAKDSLLWLIDEAKKYNAVVSYHVNMCDAYKNSPLWETYWKNGLIVKNKDGSAKDINIWDGEMSYHINKSREWETGFAQKRIDEFCEFLPVCDAGTVHIDVFDPRNYPDQGITVENEIKAMIEILKYWKKKGVDVTKEWFHHEFAGMTPMVYHLNLDENSRLKYSSDIICGGGEGWNQKHNKIHHSRIVWGGVYITPESGCMYEEAWGCSIDNDITSFGGIENFRRQFYTKTLPWQFLNHYEHVKHINTKEKYIVEFTGDIISSVNKNDRCRTITQRGRLIAENNDLFVPALWKGKEIIAYSYSGCKKEWELPEDWKGLSILKLSKLSEKGETFLEEKKSVNNKIQLTINPDEALKIIPAE
jgi:hypothetical protein